MASATADPELLVERRESVLVLTLNRPGVLNALTGAMLAGLADSLRSAEKDAGVRAVILTAKGRAFCAGADLADLKARQQGAGVSLGDELRRHFNPLILQIRRLEKPVIGAVNGLAAGAGASLILSCDVKFAAPHARFILAFGQVGLAPDSGMTYYLPRHLGLSLAIEHAWTGRPITADRALEFGLVNRVASSEEEALALAWDTARELASKAPLALGRTKRAMNAALDHDLETQLEFEAELQEALGKTQDHAEGVAAFLEKRKPVFKGE